jgi:hypothetical protein
MHILTSLKDINISQGKFWMISEAFGQLAHLCLTLGCSLNPFAVKTDLS